MKLMITFAPSHTTLCLCVLHLLLTGGICCVDVQIKDEFS